jgi:hypothetical protein
LTFNILSADGSETPAISKFNNKDGSEAKRLCFCLSLHRGSKVADFTGGGKKVTLENEVAANRFAQDGQISTVIAVAAHPVNKL